MFNFYHAELHIDGDREQEIAKRIRIKATQTEQINKLQFILNKRLNKKLFLQINISEIDDFVILKRKQFIRKITLGSCLLRLVKSYLPDLSKVAFKPNHEFVKQMTNIDHNSSKIVGFQMNSRHKRGKIKAKANSLNDNNDDQIKYRTTYKIFIQYMAINETISNKFRNSSKTIEGWICSCPNGRKIAGACAHVATVIYYLSYGKYKQIKSPAEYLNLVLVDTKKCDQANIPNIIRAKRGKRDIESSTDESATDSEDDIPLGILIKNKEKKRKPQNQTQVNYLSKSATDSEDDIPLGILIKNKGKKTATTKPNSSQLPNPKRNRFRRRDPIEDLTTKTQTIHEPSASLSTKSRTRSQFNNY